MEEKANYIIDPGTMCLQPAIHPEFATIIHDVSGSYYSRKTIMTLLNEACILKGGADYSGKLRAIRQQLEYLKKTPLIISIPEQIYGFPTTSPDQHGCIWIFPRHVKGTVFENGVNHVVFNNGLKIPINCSIETFKRQMERSSRSYLHYINLLPTQICLCILGLLK